jgi:AAA domain
MAIFKFDPTEKIAPDQWLIDHFVPLGQLVSVIAKRGAGTSFWVEAMAVCIACNKPFLGAGVSAGDVLIIDQHIPEMTLKRRLACMAKAMDCAPAHEICIYSMEGLSIQDTPNVIKQHPAAVMVLIDSIDSISGGFDCNSANANDMECNIAKIKNECLHANRTVIITHHMPQSTKVTIEELMTGDPARLAMDNSVPVQEVDSYYILGSPCNKSGKMSSLYVRPILKKQAIPSGPVILDFRDNDSGMSFAFNGEYPIFENECQEDIMLMFRHDVRNRKVREVYNDLKEQHGVVRIRKELRVLACQGKLIERREKSTAFVYRLPEKTDMMSPVQ